MQTLFYTVGLPASGKDFLANQMIEKSQGQLKRINKDLLRLMVDDTKWSQEREKIIIKSRDVLIKFWLQKGFDVICTDTNFALKHVQAFKDLVQEMGNEINVKLEKIDLTNVSISTCIKRDLQRENSVGEKVISDMYFKFIFDRTTWTKPIKEPASNAIIVDLDGTLAIRETRSPYDASRYGEDLFNFHLWYLIKDQNIIYLSGREGTEEGRRTTIEWLKKYTGIKHDEFYMDRLFMRKEGDHRPDFVIKEEIYNNEIEPFFNIIACYDDRDQVVNLWRSKRLFCLQCNYGSF